MQDFTVEGQARLAALARQQGFSPEAVAVLARALRRGGGRQAQFSHPELGGMGQWSAGGMLMIGDMFNNGLKARVAALCDALVETMSETMARGGLFTEAERAGGGAAAWWPAALGRPSSQGAQDGMRYAHFPAERRLAVEREGRVTLYDTGDLQLSGFGQQQGGGGLPLSLSGTGGPVPLDSLPVVEPPPRPQAGGGDSDIPALIERLAALHLQGILTDAEFSAKKAELLARL
ncbi:MULTISPECIES: SHOCT domain-containing protein [Acetobacterales]|uniref:SHOCT domain-containing protein n=1 Tax=Roseomonas sp. WGS1072 TaxID=3366816 RepID=UPI003BF2ABF1